jgi:spore germination protein YaaH
VDLFDGRLADARGIGRVLPRLLIAVLVGLLAPASVAPPSPAAAASLAIPAAPARSFDGAAVARAPVPAGVAATAFAASRSPAPAPAPAPTSPSAGTAQGLHREVFGFLPYWELADPSLRLRYGLLSTIAYFSVGVGADGGLRRQDATGNTTPGWAGWTGARMTAIIAAAHRNHTRVVLTLSMFAWTAGGAAAQARLLDDPAARRRLAREAARAVHDRRADGLNLDFEPLAAGHEDGFVALVREIRRQLDRTGRGYQLTFDTMGRVGNYPIARATGRGAADAVFVMAYDYRTSGSAIAGSIAPLSGPQYDLADTLLAYLDAIPASRIVLGIGWYGRAWPTVSDDLNAATRATAKYGGSSAVPYAQAVAAASGRPVRWDPREGTTWFAYRRETCSGAYGCVSTWRQVYYDDVRALRLKYDLVNLAGIRGVGIWALGYEGSHSEVWTAIADKFARDTTPPRAAIRVLSSEQRDEGFVVDWSAWDDRSGVVSYDVQVSIDGGPWRAWLKATASGADVWLGRNGHAYKFRVRARDRAGNVGAWSSTAPSSGVPTLRRGAFARVLVDGLSARERPSPVAAQRDTLAAGTLVSIADAPVSFGGVTWVAVREPIAVWPPISLVHTGVWVAASDAGARALLQPVAAPDSTRVAAGISGLAFGGVGSASIGSGVAARSAARTRSVSIGMPASPSTP